MSAATTNAVAEIFGTPATGNLPPQPQPGPDPVENGLPHSSTAITAPGTLLNYLPVPATVTSPRCSIEVKRISSPIVGIMDPRGNQHTTGTFSANWGELLFTYMLDPAAQASAGTTLLQTQYWELLTQVVIAANQPWSYEKGITSGIAQATTTSFAYTIGAKIGGSYQGITAELSASLTQSFSTTVTITEQTTQNQRFSVVPQSYPQIVGIYQLKQNYSVVPGANLNQWLTAMNDVFDQGGPFCRLTGSCSHVAKGPGAIYTNETYLQLVAHDASMDLAAGRPPVMAPSEAEALVKTSLEVAAMP